MLATSEENSVILKSTKSLYLSKKDVCEALILLLAERHEIELAAHVKSSLFEMEFSTDGELIIDIEGVFVDREIGGSLG